PAPHPSSAALPSGACRRSGPTGARGRGRRGVAGRGVSSGRGCRRRPNRRGGRRRSGRGRGGGGRRGAGGGGGGRPAPRGAGRVAAPGRGGGARRGRQFLQPPAHRRDVRRQTSHDRHGRLTGQDEGNRVAGGEAVEQALGLLDGVVVGRAAGVVEGAHGRR